MNVETFQNPFELDQLVAVFDQLNPARVLEIGAWHGGTLRYWIGEGRRVVVIDDEMRRADDWRRWAADEGCSLRLLQGMSQDELVIDQARELGPYDFVFVDGDHSYSGVSGDWHNYRPMVADGGVFVFHDVLYRPAYGVHQVWAAIKQQEGSRYMEIAHNATTPGSEGPCGIGLVWPT